MTPFLFVILRYTGAMIDFIVTDMYVHLFLAMALGMVLGVERFIAHKTAGMRTYTLVSLGSALFIIISQQVALNFPFGVFDPLRIAAQIVAAAGFLGVGAIFHTSTGRTSGITTASGLWVAAGIGMACGFGLYALAVLVTVLALFTFIVLWFIEAQLRKLPINQDSEREPL